MKFSVHPCWKDVRAEKGAARADDVCPQETNALQLVRRRQGGGYERVEGEGEGKPFKNKYNQLTELQLVTQAGLHIYSPESLEYLKFSWGEGVHKWGGVDQS